MVAIIIQPVISLSSCRIDPRTSLLEKKPSLSPCMFIIQKRRKQRWSANISTLEWSIFDESYAIYCRNWLLSAAHCWAHTIKCIVLCELYLSLLSAHAQKAMWRTKNRIYNPIQKARGKLKRRDFKNLALHSLLVDRRRPFYRRHVLYAYPTCSVLTLLIKCMLPVKRIFC